MTAPISSEPGVRDNGHTDVVARERLKFLSREMDNQRKRVDEMGDEVSEVRRDMVSIKPTVETIKKLMMLAVIGMGGLIGTQVWQLIMARGRP